MRGEQNFGDFVVATKNLRKDMEREAAKENAQNRDSKSKDSKKKKNAVQTNVERNK